MNRIYVVNDTIEKQTLDGSVSIDVVQKNDFFSVNSMKLHILADTTIWIYYEAKEEIKLDIFIRVDPHVQVTINEVRTGKRTKVQYKYYLDEYADIKVNKFYHASQVREFDIVNLNGTGASIRTILKSIATAEEKYDMMIYHNAKETSSDILNHAVVDQKGKLTFNVTSSVPKGKTGCYANQMNRVINLNDHKCKICPNLLIDEYDVTANHAALIGKFEDDELFYLQSRGLTREEAVSLLMKGFLCSYIEEPELRNKIEDSMNQYWR